MFPEVLSPLSLQEERFFLELSGNITRKTRQLL